MSRYFLGKDAGAVIRDKLAFAGDDTKADAIITSYLANRAGWTAPEVDKTTFDASVVVPDPAVSRSSAIDELLSGISDEAKLNRAILLVILDEINVIRTLPALAQTIRTVSQLKTAIQNKINSGLAD